MPITQINSGFNNIQPKDSVENRVSPYFITFFLINFYKGKKIIVGKKKMEEEEATKPSIMKKKKGWGKGRWEFPSNSSFSSFSPPKITSIKFLNFPFPHFSP